MFENEFRSFLNMSDADIDQAVHCMSNEPNESVDAFDVFTTRMQLAEHQAINNVIRR